MWVKARSLNGSKFVNVFHQVRDPLKCVTSIAFTEPIFRENYEKFLMRHIPSLVPLSDLTDKLNLTSDQAKVHRAVEFYLAWNGLFAQLKLPTYRLEDVVAGRDFSAVRRMFVAVGKDVPDDDALRQVASQRRTRRRSNRHRRRLETAIRHNQRQHRGPVSFREICQVSPTLAERLLDMSREFGYYNDVDDDTNRTTSEQLLCGGAFKDTRKQ